VNQWDYKLTGSDVNRIREYYEFCGDKKEAYKEWLRYKIKTDLFFFGNEFLEWKNATDATGRRHRIDPVFHPWLCSLLIKPGWKMIIVPRFHMKSTWAKLRICQRIIENPNIRIGLFAATGRLVEKHLSWIRRILSLPKLRELFPDQLPHPGKMYKRWEKSTANELTVWRDPNQDHVPQEPQILAVGVGAEITGFHLDDAYLDDVVTDENVKTQHTLNEIEDWWEYLQPILEPGSDLTFTNTPYHYRDLSARIELRGEIPQDMIFRRKNIENGKVIYSSWFTREYYDRQKRILSPYKYACQWECNAVPDEDRIFPPPQPIYNGHLPNDERGYRYYCAIDPAATTEKYSDSTGVAICAVNHLNQVFVIESYSFKKRGDEICDFIIRKHLQYGFKRIGIELGLQAHLMVVLKMKLSEHNKKNKDNLRLPVMEIPMKRDSKAHRIDTMLGSLVRTGKILISATLSGLIGQMDNFTGKQGDEDDEVDALSMIPYLVETFAAHQNLDERFKIRELTWRDFFKKKNGNGWRGSFIHSA
jgi:hypothetical protein